MSTDGKNFLQMATVSAVIITLFYLIGGGDPPEIQDAAGSGIEGVEKAIDSVGKTTSAYQEPSEAEIDGLMTNQNYQEVIQSSTFQTLVEMESFHAVCKDDRFWKYMNGLKSSERYQPSSEFRTDEDFQWVTSSEEFQELQQDPDFLSLMTEPTFIALVQSGGGKLQEVITE